MFQKEFLRDEPRGGFVTEVVCPFCGVTVSGNIPATPEKKIVGYFRSYEAGVYSTNRCTGCRETFFVHRYSDSSWVVRRSSDAPRKI